jgi:hypothetical protein
LWQGIVWPWKRRHDPAQMGPARELPLAPLDSPDQRQLLLPEQRQLELPVASS